jgi:mannose-6-phosphate isomerase-like protein (cupin superfamily)
MSALETVAGHEPYSLNRERGVTDVWWPFGPAPAVSRWSVKISGEQTGGRLAQILTRDPRGTAPPLHLHHEMDETFYVIDGNVSMFVGDQRIEAGPGDFVFIPMRAPHAFLVTSEWAESLVTCSPAGIEGPAGFGIAGFFRDVAIPVTPAEPPPEPRTADPAELARRMALYGIEMLGPPPTLD